MIEGQLYGVKPLDPAVMTAAILTMELAGLAAWILPVAVALVWTRRPCCASSNHEPKQVDAPADPESHQARRVGVYGHLAQAAQATLTTIYNFTYGLDGGYPYGALLVSQTGALYGMAGGGQSDCGGEPDCGIIFELTPPAAPGGSWTETTIYSFPTFISAPGWRWAKRAGSTAPLHLFLLLTMDPFLNYHLLGTWTYTALYNFQGGNDGSSPAGLVLSDKGQIYGTTGSGGGAADAGTVFELTPHHRPEARGPRLSCTPFKVDPTG
ncbi:MAG: hypothetical protein ABSH32_29460 [Bryobacteraceae bacterium]